MRYAITISASLALATITIAAQKAAVVYVPADKVAAALKDGTRIAAGSDFTALGAKRTGPGQVEVHEKETDTFYVIDGEATFVTGGKMIGGKISRPNQWLGTSIEGGETHHLKKGDFIEIPAGMPHWFKEVPSSITYYVVKAVKP
jgi:mannose-6-phosphate isomerase-like protein (cupin superfamily)